MKDKITIAEAIEQLKQEPEFPFTCLMKHGTMSIEYYAPKDLDEQQPHLQDEIYIIASGKSQFKLEEKKLTCSKGDVLFVPAGMEHCFEHFSEDFATWVIFYGPQGGEKE